MKTARHLLFSLLALFGVGLTVIAFAGDGDLLDALLQRSATRGTRVVPDRFLRSWDPITVFYGSSKGKVGPEDSPDRFAKLRPEHPGAWTWLDASTLQFRPAEPWPALAVFSVDADNQRFDLASLLSPPVKTVPQDGAVGLDPVSQIELTFTSPIPLETLNRLIDLRLEDLPAIGAGPARRLGPDDWEIKAVERSKPSDPAVYVLRLDRPIPAGVRATLALQLSVDRDAPEAITALRFSTAEPFRIAGFGCANQTVPASPSGTRYAEDQPFACGGPTEVHVHFSARIPELGPVDARGLLRFTPAVEELSFVTTGQVLIARGQFERDKVYRVDLAPTPIRDHSARLLDLRGESSLWLYFPRREPYLRWSQTPGVLERGGPRALPIEGRATAQADLRIYRVDPMNRELWPFPSAPVEVNEGARPAGPGEQPEPWTRTGPIPANQLAQRLQLLGSPGVSAVVDLPLTESAATAGLDLAPHLDSLVGKGEAGHFLVGLRKLDGKPTRSWVRVQVTDLALTTVEEPDAVTFFVTRLSDGKPVSGAEVRLDGAAGEKGESWGTIFSGRTGGDGSVRWKAPGAIPKRPQRVERVSATYGSDVLVLDPRATPEAFRDDHWYKAWGTWLGWTTESLADRVEAPKLLAHLFTERPVYRPGDPVHLKGFVRLRDQGRLKLSPSKGHLIVFGPDGQEWRLPADQSPNGSIYAKWEEPEPATGTYSVHYETANGDVIGQTDFLVEAYRLPTFEVKLHAPDQVAMDAPFDLSLTAAYYAGGKVTERPVRWRVTQYPHAWSPKALPGFSYSSDGRFSPTGRFEAGGSLSREALTDTTGAASLRLDPTAEPSAQARTYVVEATVTGLDEQTVTTTTRVHAVPAFALGLKVPRFLERGEAIPIELLAVSHDGTLLAGREVDVRLTHRQWHHALQTSDFSDGTARYLTEVVDVPVSAQTVRTTAAPLALSLPVPRAGVYVVEISSQDDLGRAQTVLLDLYVGGSGAIAWEKPKAGVFKLSPDAADYKAGDTAAIVLRSPYTEGEALVVIEAPDRNRYQWVPVRNGQATLRVPIEKGWVPRIPIHVVLQRGRNGEAPPKDPAGLDLGRPATVAGSTWLTVRPVENQVQVAVEAPVRALPGETVPVTIRLKDPDGRPLSGEVTLWLVDQAVLALGTERRLDPVPDLITGRSSRMELRDSRNLVPGRIPYSEMPGGDDEELAAEDPLDNATVRKNFQAVPYYNPALVVGPSGQLTVQVKLSDDLTVFKIRAKAVSGAERLGAGSGQIAVRLPLVVQPALPRFVRPGDQFDAVAIGRIVEGDGGAGAASIQVDGLTLGGPASRSLSWDPVRPERLAFPVAVPQPGLDSSGRLARDTVRVKVGVARDGDGAKDAFEVLLPLVDDRGPVFDRALVELKPGAKVDIAALTEAARPGSVQRTVVASDLGALARMAAAADLLLRPSADATEVRISRARAWLGLGELRGAFGLDAGKERMDAEVLETLGLIRERLDGRGLVANLPGRPGQVWVSAAALELLVDAKRAGLPVDNGVHDGLVRVLQQALRSDAGLFLDGEAWWERTTALHALAAAGKADAAYLSELARNARWLDTEGKARVVRAAGDDKGPASQELALAVSNDLIVRLYEGREVYGGLNNLRTDRNPLVLPGEARTLAWAVRALSAARPTDPKLPLAVDALVGVGGRDGWGNPNADGAALLALSEHLRARTPGPGKLTVSHAGANTNLALGAKQPVMRWESSTEAGFSLTGTGVPVSALVSSRWVPAAPASAQAPEAAGLVVERSWALLQDSGPPKKVVHAQADQVHTLAVGQVVEEIVRVTSPSTRHYVAITLPLAAGFEALNPALATAGPEARPSTVPARSPDWVQALDDRIVWWFETLPAGTWELAVRTRATTPGRFGMPPAQATLVYDPTVRGQGAGAVVVVEAK